MLLNLIFLSRLSPHSVFLSHQQGELEKLNQSSEDINRWETELEVGLPLPSLSNVCSFVIESLFFFSNGCSKNDRKEDLCFKLAPVSHTWQAFSGFVWIRQRKSFICVFWKSCALCCQFRKQWVPCKSSRLGFQKIIWDMSYISNVQAVYTRSRACVFSKGMKGKIINRRFSPHHVGKLASQAQVYGGKKSVYILRARQAVQSGYGSAVY